MPFEGIWVLAIPISPTIACTLAQCLVHFLGLLPCGLLALVGVRVELLGGKAAIVVIVVEVLNQHKGVFVTVEVDSVVAVVWVDVFVIAHLPLSRIS